jgi:DNA-binding MarR family transcriptional regulator
MDNEPIARHVSLAGRALSTRIEQGLAPYGIGRGEYRVLFALCNEEGVSQTTLADEHHLDKGVIARVVRRLEEKGYVERRPDPEDRRRKLLYLTDEAEELRSEVGDLKATVDAEIAQGLSEEEAGTLTDGLRTICANLGVHAGGDEDESGNGDGDGDGDGEAG